MQLAEYVVLLILIAFIFRPSYYCGYRQSHPSKIIYYSCSSKHIEVKVGWLFEHVLLGCTVTESKCSRINNITLGILYSTREIIFKALVSGEDTMKVCT